MEYSQRGVIYTIKTLARVRALPPATAMSTAPLRDGRPAEPRALTRLRRLPTVYLWGLSLAVVLLGALRAEFADIANTLPYPHHVDEPAVARAGLHIISTGSFRPETFNYPALPKYLAAAGLGVGVIRAARNREIL